MDFASPRAARIAVFASLFALTGCSDDTNSGGSGGGGNGGEGGAAAANFHVRGELVGLYGGTVSVTLDGAETVSLESDGTFEFDTMKADGADFEVSVTEQPAGFDQVCSVTPASGSVDGADVALSVECTGGPALRITEIGSCYYQDSSCWLELHNVTAFDTDLASYTLRTSAGQRVDPFDVFESEEFALPSLVVPADGYVLVRGDAYELLVDGPQVVHVRNGDHVPYWYSDGFVELLYSGASVDFARFGNSQVEPTGGAGWTSGAAPSLPNAPEEYGRSLARDLAETDTDAPADFHLRAFATSGGPNDVDEDTDDDDDGIPDQAERPGGTYAGLDLYAMGLREGQPDILIEIDWMDSGDVGTTPRREALEKVVAAFAPHGIAVHFDAGSLFGASFDPASFNLGGGNPVTYSLTLTLNTPFPGQPTVYEYKAENFDIRRQGVAHYALFGSSQEADGSQGSSGYAELPGNDLIITLGGWELSDATLADRTELYNLQAATLMHELGHNLNLHHGGGTDINGKPNYISIMNYAYQLYGLPVIGTPDEGDRYALDENYNYGFDCGLFDSSELVRGPFDPEMLIDYSDGSGAQLDETAVFEPDGLGRVNSAPVDFDCDGSATQTIAADLNFNGNQNANLNDYDDWSNIVLVFRRVYDGSDTGFDPVSDDRQPVALEHAPPPAMLLSRQLRRLP
ncbi:MAG: hypothetical protein U0271_19680 [Polyangiaceae bacterium]